MNKVKLAVVVAAVAGGVAVVLRRNQRRSSAEADLWAEATDHVTPAR